MSDLEYKIASEFKEVYERLTIVEQDLRRHEQIVVVVITILGGLGWLSYIKVQKWIRGFIEEQVAQGLKTPLAAAAKTLEDALSVIAQKAVEIQHLKESATVYDELLKARVSATPGTQYMIQFGERPIAFGGSNYVASYETFEKEFPVTPKIFVGEAGAGAWLVVKVDERNTQRFKWAANNLLGASDYKTVVQWVAVAEIPKHKTDPEIAVASADGKLVSTDGRG